MSTRCWYMWVKPLQSPRGIGTDTGGRAIVGFNVSIKKVASAKLERELVAILVDAGVGVFGKTLFAGTEADITAKGTIVSIYAEGGSGPEYVQEESSVPKYELPHAQVRVYAEKYEDAMEKARAAYAALAAVKNQDITAA